MVLLLGLGGCAAQPAGHVVWYQPEGGRRATGANLVFGPPPHYADYAALFAGRARWPVADAGYRLGEASYYADITVDDQSFYDRRGGGHYQSATTYRTGLFLR